MRLLLSAPLNVNRIQDVWGDRKQREMSRDTKTLTTTIGVVYLCAGLSAFPALAMYLL